MVISYLVHLCDVGSSATKNTKIKGVKIIW